MKRVIPIIIIIIMTMTACRMNILEDKELKEISITKLPIKTTYLAGEFLDLTGIEITGKYKDDTYEIVKIEKENVSGFSQKLGEQEIEIKVEGKKAYFRITVIPNVETIEIINYPNLNYYVGDSFKTDGMNVVVIMTDGTQKLITNWDVSYPDMSSSGEKKIVVSYTENNRVLKQEFKITVNEVIFENYEISIPIKTEYFEQENIDITGLKILEVYNNGSKKDITKQVELSISNLKPLEIKDTKVSIQYKDKVISEFKITVNEVVLAKIEIKAPDKVEYIEGDYINLNGLKVTAVYNNGKTLDVTKESVVDISLEEKLIEGVKKIKVLYNEIEEYFYITVKKVEENINI